MKVDHAEIEIVDQVTLEDNVNFLGKENTISILWYMEEKIPIKDILKLLIYGRGPQLLVYGKKPEIVYMEVTLFFFCKWKMT